MKTKTHDKTARSIPHDIVPIEWQRMNAAYVLQSPAWARVKAQFGWEPLAFRQTRYTTLHQDVLVLFQKVRGLGYVGYIPDGLLVSNATTDYTAHSYHKAREAAFELLYDIAQVVHMHYGKNVMCLRWDAPWCVRREEAEEFFPEFCEEKKRAHCVYTCARGSIYSGTYVQPAATVVVDLRKSEEEILKKMKAKTRYNIRLAQKRGVSICEGLSLDAFYALYEVTSKRNGIAIHSKKYYGAVLEALHTSSKSEIHMYGAYYEGELIAAGMVSYYRADGHNEACYLYGATANEHRNLMPMYLLQWQAMCEARRNACMRYDLFGIPINERDNSSMQGLYRFKVGFGGAVCLRGGGFACVPTGFGAHIRYTLFRLAEHGYKQVLKLRSGLRTHRRAWRTARN